MKKPPAPRRGRGASSRVRLGAHGLQHHAGVRLGQRAAGIVIDPSGVRKDAAERAYKTLAMVADCKVAIDTSDALG